MSQKSSYPIEFREKVVQEAIEIGNIRAVADKHGIVPTTVYSWVKAFKNKKANQSKKSIKDLERELAEKELENKILKELLKKTTQTLIKD